MRVFISWSKDRSRAIAEIFRDWLPCVLQCADVFYSSYDIPSGGRSLEVLSRELDETDIGIVCLTPENQYAPWVLFESGALSKSIAHGRLFVCLYGFERLTDVGQPLAMFQLTDLASDEQIAKMMHDLNAASTQPLKGKTLTDTLELWLPKLRAKLKKIPKLGEAEKKELKERGAEDMLQEILALLRAKETKKQARQAGRESLGHAIELAVARQRVIDSNPKAKFRDQLLRLLQVADTEIAELKRHAPTSQELSDVVRERQRILLDLENLEREA